jgi:predicted transcriptional regulator
LTDAQLVEVRLAVREAKNGQFATDEEMANLWRKFGL